MPIQLSNAAVLVNDEVVTIVPNSLKFNEGQGEKQVRAGSTGGGGVEQIFSENVEDALGKVSFSIHTTPANVELQRKWQANKNRNVVTIAGSTDEGEVTRTYTQAAVVNDPDVEVASEGVIALEWMANAPV